jgi:2-C-methyl-D-erythritol 2,4-cyclodiphosphate synthase
LRVGLGADAHALVEGVPLVLGGVELDSPFPSGEAEWEGASSLDLLARAYAQVREAGFALANADCVLVGEGPRIAPVREAMQARLAEAMGVEAERVTVRATTTDRLGFTGRGEGLAALAVALLE